MALRKPYLLLGSVTLWIILGHILRGKNTLQIDTYENTSFTSFVGKRALELRGNRSESPAFIYFFNPIRGAIDGFVQVIRNLIAVPAPNSVIPIIVGFDVVGVDLVGISAAVGADLVGVAGFNGVDDLTGAVVGFVVFVIVVSAANICIFVYL